MSEELNRQDYINKIANLANNLNNKKRQFDKAGYGYAYEGAFDNLTVKYTDTAELRTKTGMLSKSKKEISKLSDEELIDLFNTYTNLQHHKRLKTVKQYDKFVQKRNRSFDKAFERVTGQLPDFDNEKHRLEMYKALEHNRQRTDGKQTTSEQVLLQIYAEVFAEDEEEKKEMQQVIKKRQESIDRLAKFKVGKNLPQKGGNKR